MEECVETNYDTYIEYKFFQKLDTCIKNKKNAERIRTAWLNDKALYIDLTKTIEFEFMHYSLHDASHSINILQCIYMILGRKKIDRLSVGDLWLLLECAYSHDIGMATCYNELKSFWQDSDKVEEIIIKISTSSDSHIIEMYKQIKNYLESEDIDYKTINMLKEHKEWPLEIRKAVTYINSEYIRVQHAKRSQTKIESILDEVSRLKIEERLYKIVGKIDYLHGTDFSNILKILKAQDIGFETDKIHPRFIAQLLRLGDCLDIRNNRFDYGNIHYQGGLTGISNLHYEKHKNVTHFMIDERKIQIYIDSDDIEVCRNAREWFDIIEKQIELLMKYWNAFAPECLGHLKLSDIDLRVTYKNNIFNYDNIDRILKTSPQKVMELLIGSNLYNTNLVCIREYIQNALDATKIRIAHDLNKDKEFSNIILPAKLHDISPYNIPEEYYDKYPIEIKIGFSDNINNILEIQIVDNGIGMDKEGIKALFNIGSGWKSRDNIKKLLLEMPEWLLPTGGFGIGLLSGFLLTDTINIKTKSFNENRYKLAIHYTANGLQSDQTLETDYYDSAGTTVSVEVPFEQLYYDIIKWINQPSNRKSNGNLQLQKSFLEGIQNVNILNQNDSLLFAYNFLVYFIKQNVLNSIIPIKISCPMLNKTTDVEKKSDKNISKIWVPKFLTYVTINSENNIDLVKIGYRGIYICLIDQLLIKNESLVNIFSKCFSYIDIYIKNVQDVLMLNRAAFKDNYKLENLLNNILIEYMKYIVKNIHENKIFVDQLEKIVIYFYSNNNKDIITDDILNLLPKNCYIDNLLVISNLNLIEIFNDLLQQIDDIKNRINNIDSFTINTSTDQSVVKDSYINLNCIFKNIMNFKQSYESNETNFESDKVEELNENIAYIEEFYKICKNLTEENTVQFIKKLINVNLSNLNEELYTKLEKYKEIWADTINKIKNQNTVAKKIQISTTSLVKELLTSNKISCTTKYSDFQLMMKDDKNKSRTYLYYINQKDSNDDGKEFNEYINEIKKYMNLSNSNNLFYKEEYKKDKQLSKSFILKYNYNLTNNQDTNTILEQFNLLYGMDYSHNSGRDHIEINNWVLDVTAFSKVEKEKYTPIILKGLHYYNDKEYIINPFSINQKLSKKELFLDEIIGKLLENESNKYMLSDEQISKKILALYEGLHEFEHIVNLVYYMQNKRYTKDLIKKIYYELIGNVVLSRYKYIQNKDVLNKREA